MNKQNTNTNIEQGKGIEPIHKDNGDSGKKPTIGTIYVVRHSPVDQKYSLEFRRVAPISTKKKAQNVCSSKGNATRIIRCRRIR